MEGNDPIRTIPENRDAGGTPFVAWKSDTLRPRTRGATMTEETIFQEALARSPQNRARFLDQACSGQPQLRAAVEALLAAHREARQLTGQAAGNLAATMDSQPARGGLAATGEHTPDACGSRDADVPRTLTTDYRRDAVAGVVIGGRYTLQEKLGEGGMGEVWVARQIQPVKRRVALKLIKVGMDSRAVLARFEQERQALALMDHPNIARVLDGGITPEGQPFFVMELVNGLPLTKFCDEARLTPQARLELFVPVCQAVQHAHQKGIVHRDLKPSNILVTINDGKPVPKIIDFGVAKAMAGKLGEESDRRDSERWWGRWSTCRRSRRGFPAKTSTRGPTSTRWA